MIHRISIANETMPAFKESLQANKTDFEEISNLDGRTEFILNLKFTNELFYLGVSYGVNCLSNSVANTVSPELSN